MTRIVGSLREHSLLCKGSLLFGLQLPLLYVFPILQEQWLSHFRVAFTQDSRLLELAAPLAKQDSTALALIPFNPEFVEDKNLVAQYASIALLMVYFWYSLCFGPIFAHKEEHDKARNEFKPKATKIQADLSRSRLTKAEEELKKLAEEEGLRLRKHIEELERTKLLLKKEQQKMLIRRKLQKDLKSKDTSSSPQERGRMSRREPAPTGRTKSASSKSNLKCPSCHAESSPAWKFCSSCGTQLFCADHKIRRSKSTPSKPPQKDERPLVVDPAEKRIRSASTGPRPESVPAKKEDCPTSLQEAKPVNSQPDEEKKTIEESRAPEDYKATAEKNSLNRSKSTGSISYKTAREPDPESEERDAPESTEGKETVLCLADNGQRSRRPSNTLETIPKNTPGNERSSKSKLGKYSAILISPTADTQVDHSEDTTTASEALSVKFRKTDSVCIGSRLWPLSHLLSKYQPKWGHPNKALIASIASSPDHDGWVRASRWSRPSALPNRIKRAKVYAESGQFSYDTSGAKRDHKTVHWHLNFAGDRLFRTGGGTMISTYDVHAMEHPCLPSLALAIEDQKSHGVEGLSTRTSDAVAGPTPILIKGALRSCSIDAKIMRFKTFSEPSEETVRSLTNQLQIPSRTNILALPSITPGKGKYTAAQIRRLFIYAYTGFRAIVLESGGQRAILHTGFWGCDDGLEGDKGLTAAIQILAAGSAGIKYMHFKPGNHSAHDRSAMWHGINVANELHCRSFDSAIKILAGAGYSWRDDGPSHLPYQPPPDSMWTN